MPGRLVWIALLAALVAACSPAEPARLPQDVYIWRFQWNGAVTAALADAAGSVRAFRVLAASMDGSGWREAKVDGVALASAHTPVVFVVRIEGQLVHWDEAKLRRAVVALAARWKADGIPVSAVEIDHDCGTARLPAYAAFLAALRDDLPRNMSLSLTALPAWLGSPALADVLVPVDEAVLQVHSVSFPGDGLFDPSRAIAWMRSFAKVMDKPWRVALPTYGSKLVWDEKGRIAAVESERPLLVAGTGAIELVSQPTQMAAFLAALDRDPPRHMAGVAWFRLPASDDVRAWSLPTWLAVARREPLTAHISTRAATGGERGLYDIVLVSDGNIDAAVPAAIRLARGCAAADGINGYAAERAPEGFTLKRTRERLLRPAHTSTVGWARCETGPPTLAAD